jgi:hypothetical protein
LPVRLVDNVRKRQREAHNTALVSMGLDTNSQTDSGGRQSWDGSVSTMAVI